MKKIAFILLGVIMVGIFLLPGCNPKQGPATKVKQVMWSTDMGIVDTGIVAALEEAYEQKTGVKVRHVSSVSADALKLARGGAFDVVLADDAVLEDKFVADGYGTMRVDFMYDDYVIIGPPNDPAGIKGQSSTAALKKIADKKASFVSRGDQSGTNMKELAVWAAAGIKPAGDWYKVNAGAKGDKATLLFADAQKAYTIIDRATYINTHHDISLEILAEKDEALRNYISLIPVNPAKVTNIKSEEANRFVQWLVSAEGQRIVKEFGIDHYKEPIFFPNSVEGKKL